MSSDDIDAQVEAHLAASDRLHEQRFSCPSAPWQPVHTVYVPAELFTADTVGAWGAEAAGLFARIADRPEVLAELVRVEDPDELAALHRLVAAKLASDPIEDLRIDFEDGYRGADEDADLARVLGILDEVGAAALPRRLGIRFKSLERPTRARGVRTLRAFVDGVSDEALARTVVTLPKVTALAQVEAMAMLCRDLEQGRGLPAGALRLEIQVETPRSVMDEAGCSPLPGMIHAAEGRCIGLHYGTYDYSASLGVAAAWQSLDHPVADHAKAVMQVAAAETGVDVVDGSTNRIAVGDDVAVRTAWRRHGALVTRGLRQGLYQGWDIHPSVLPSRFLATYAFFRGGIDEAAGRLQAYAGANASGEHMDEPATVRALAGFLLRALACGAVEAHDARLAGLTADRLTAWRS